MDLWLIVLIIVVGVTCCVGHYCDYKRDKAKYQYYQLSYELNQLRREREKKKNEN